MNSESLEVKVILTSPWRFDKYGVIPARIVLWRYGGGTIFVVNMEVKTPTGELYFVHTSGYNLNITEGLDTFNRRVGELGFGDKPIGEIYSYANRWLIRTSDMIEQFLTKKEEEDFREKYLNLLKS